MYESEVRAVTEVLAKSGLGGDIKAFGKGSMTYRVPTPHGTIEISLIFYGSNIHTTAVRVDNLVNELQDSNPLTVDGARSAAKNIVARLSGAPKASTG